ncbi:MAG: LPS export ABC transporter ATP-binding protein [Candidatus Ancaeobacter aquaticus]|nr:LPS export ABC transporter ATP-binding protein [Candidatus Ancaeobacter aquaticus]
MELLRTENLIKQYKSRKVVNGVEITVNKGEIVGLLGPNGAGKTTTFYMIVGLVKPNKGNVFFKKVDITKLPMSRRAQLGIGYLSQEPSIFRKLTVEENIMAILETLNITPVERRKRLKQLLEELKIAHLAKSIAYTLSGGERRRLEITRAMVTRPTFILLDEPFSGVDPIAVFDVQQMILELRDKGLGILLTDHSVRETLSITDRAYIMNDSRILISGTADELVNNPKAREIYLGEKFTM